MFLIIFLLKKKIIDKNEFENNIKHKNLRDSQIEDLERILSKREDEITWLHVFLLRFINPSKYNKETNARA